MTKALIVTPVYPVPDNPQAGIFVHRQIANLARAGVECHVLTYRPGPPAFPRWLRRRSWLRYYWHAIGWPGERDGVPSEIVFYERRWEPGEDVVPAIGRALVAHVEARPELHDVDVVYAHWYWTGGAAALALRERFGWPVVTISRGSDMHEWQEINPRCRGYVERVIREADVLLANCGDLRSRAEALVPGSSERIEVVYNGCDARVFRPAEDRAALRRELGIGEDEKIMLFCGYVCARKGLPELAEAWPAFAARHPDWKLAIVGETSEPAVEQTLRRATKERGIFTGRQSRDEVVRWMQAADGYVQPSRLEGLANATMEAMAVALPVVTTETCGQSELVRDGENGWLVPVEDPAALGVALDELASDPDRAVRLAREARRTIETKFDPIASASRLEEILASASVRREPVGRRAARS
jgi:glycosyltransferase involved in cell wall biosynthesis